ncbi:hypothetical protein CLIM01_00105 [Colletotrichum limetticola]|uniref:Secreted protein n=1 Tax=Colletotrichum limetticola TaxID=1209924 RepID=A0ABQ9QFN0_9PEZI|nr:hypothetical protein CLIM01_00105 [Colletotrichum limetticola]
MRLDAGWNRGYVCLFTLCVFSLSSKSCPRPTVGLHFRAIRSRTAIADRHGMNHPARPRPVDPSLPASQSDGPPPAAGTWPSCPFVPVVTRQRRPSLRSCLKTWRFQ